MRRFHYEAMNRQGGVVQDEIEARDESDANRRIREMNLFPTRIGERADAQPGRRMPRRDARRQRVVVRRVRSRNLTMFTRQFSTLIDAGIPVVQSMRMLQRQMRPGALKAITGSLADEIEAGSSLSEAMAKYPSAFNSLYVNMIRAGEAAGILDRILRRLAEFREKSARLKRRVVGAMIYPIAVISIATIILLGIIILIVPKFEKMFTEMNLPLPAPTILLIRTARFCVDRWYLIPLVPIGLFALLRLIGSSRTGRYCLDWLKIRSHARPMPAVLGLLILPGVVMVLVSRIIQKAAIARFARTFGTLLQAGVPIL